MPEKYQREIEEILGGIDGAQSHDGKARKSQSKGNLVWRLLGGRGWGISPGKILLVSLVLLLTALLVKGSMPGLVAPVLWTGIVLFILGYALLFINPPSYEKRWRGRVVEPTPGWRKKLLHWLKGR